MDTIDRRRFLQLSGLAAGGVLLAACDTAPKGAGGASSGSGALRWWDQFQPIAAYEKRLFAAFAKEKGGLPVQYDVQNPDTQGQALQLAWQSKQMPDVFTLGGIDLPTSRLREQGWIAPLALDDAHRAMLPEGTLIEGLNMFDGKPYSFPILSFRSHDTLHWFNTDLYRKAGLDPANPPTTYDDIRAGARKVKKTGDGIYGWVAPLKFTPRIESQVLQMAAAAGAPISGGTAPGGGVDLRTGEYAYHTQPFVDVIEFWIAMKRDGVLFPASTSLDARTARARWATGVVGAFFDGSYNVGVIKSTFAQFLGKIGVGSIPVPDLTTNPIMNGVPANAALSFWIYKGSKHADAASALISKFAETAGQTGVAEAMDQPPLVSSVLAKAKVHPTYRTAIKLFNEQVFRGPSLEARTPKIVEVTGAMDPVQPTLGQIAASAVTGQLPNWRAALKKLSDSYAAERDKAIKKANSSGVTVDDWIFSDWRRGVDYVTKPKS